MQAATQTASKVSADARRPWFIVAFTSLVVLLNMLVLMAAARDRSWGAIWFGVIGGPVMNGVIALLSLLAIPALKRRRAQFSVWRHVAISLGMPAAAAVVDGVIIFHMDLHGC